MGILSMSKVIKPIEKKIMNNYSAQEGVFFYNFYKREFDSRCEGNVDVRAKNSRISPHDEDFFDIPTYYIILHNVLFKY